MIKQAFIHEYGNNKMEPEHSDIKSILESKNIPVTLFTQKKLDRNQLILSKETLVVGEIPVVLKALKYLGITNLNPNSYPQCLKYILKRNIWTSTIKEVIKNDLYNGVFVKPKQIAKKFTGFVVLSQNDFYKFQNASYQTELYCSEIVNWLSEFRVFVVKSEIVGIQHYAGNQNIKLNLEEVKKAIQTFENSSERTDGYGIDFGVLENGETALIEWNDGFALGSYNLEKEKYTELIISRWLELMQ